MAYNIKSQKTGFRLLPGKHVFGKITGGGSNGFRSLFGLRRSSKDKISIRNLIRFHGGF